MQTGGGDLARLLFYGMPRGACRSYPDLTQTSGYPTILGQGFLYR